MSHWPDACSFQHHKEAQDGGGHADLTNRSLGRPRRGTGVVLGFCPHPHPDPEAPRTHGRWLRPAAAPPCRRSAAPARAVRGRQPASRASARGEAREARGGGVELRRGSVEVRAAAVLQIPCARRCTRVRCRRSSAASSSDPRSRTSAGPSSGSLDLFTTRRLSHSSLACRGHSGLRRSPWTCLNLHPLPPATSAQRCVQGLWQTPSLELGEPVPRLQQSDPKDLGQLLRNRNPSKPVTI